MKYIPLLLILTACSYVHPIGTISDKKLHKVSLGSIFGAAQTMIVVEDTNTHEVTFMTPVGGNGILPSAVVAGSIIGGSALIASGGYGDEVAVNQSGNASSSSAASATANPMIQDPNPAPMIPNRPPWGPRWK